MEVITFTKKNCLLINKILIDNDHSLIISKLKNCTEDSFTLNNDNLWYYKNYKSTIKLFDLLYPNNKQSKKIFLNNDINDYRVKNIKILNEYSDLFPEPKNCKILEFGSPYNIQDGRYSGQYRNMYWKVLDNKNLIYYLVHIKDDIYTKISCDDITKIFCIENNRPCWYLQQNGYISTCINKIHKIYYLHQVVMNLHMEDLSSYQRTVDHINRDKLDNRKENLRITNMSEQNTNRDKSERRCDAIDLPDGIVQKELPKYIVYRKEIMDKETDKFREYFYICNHPNCLRWESSKSSKYSNYEKLQQTIKKLKELNEESSSDLESDSDEEEKIKMPKYISYTTFRGLPYLIFDKRHNDKRYNLKMIVKPNNLKSELNLFIEKINNKYPELCESLKLTNYINNELSSCINSESIEGINSESNNIINNFSELKIKLPANFIFFCEKETYYIQFSKTINKNRINKKISIKNNNIQEELDNLIIFLNKTYPELKIEKYIIPNLPIIKVFEEIDNNTQKPKLPINFSIPTVNNIDYIQFCKKINGERIQYKTKINSYDLQNELNNFITYLNENYNLKLIYSDYIIAQTNWKTSNKIIDHDNVTEQQNKNREKVLKFVEKKKLELGEDKFKEIRTEYMKNYRKKIKNI
jgi:hypothetical protein